MKTELFILTSILGWGVGSFLYKLATNSNAHPLMISTIALCMYVVLMPLLWIFVKFDRAISLNGVLYTLAGSLFMCIGTLGFSYALRSGGEAGRTSIITSMYPALTLLLSVIFLHEGLSVKKIIGCVCALCSIALLL